MLRRHAVALDRHLHRGLIPHFPLIEGYGEDKSSDEAMVGKRESTAVDAEELEQSQEIVKLEDALQWGEGCSSRVVGQKLRQLCPSISDQGCPPGGWRPSFASSKIPTEKSGRWLIDAARRSVVEPLTLGRKQANEIQPWMFHSRDRGALRYLPKASIIENI